MDNNERRDQLEQALVQLNQSLLSNSQMLDKALLSLSSAGLGVSLAFIKNVVPLDEATHLHFLHWSWGAFVGTIIFTLVSFITSQHGLEKQSEQTLYELADIDDEPILILSKGTDNNESKDDKEETDPSDLPFQISKWLTRFSLACYVVAVILTVLFVKLNPIGPKPN